MNAVVNYRGSLLYGAYEQKRLYQRHLSAALVTLAVTALVVLSFAACDSAPPTAPTPEPGPPFEGTFVLKEGHRQTPKSPTVIRGGRSVAVREGYHPVETTVADSALAPILAGGIDGGAFSESWADGFAGGARHHASVVSLFPDPDAFIIAEIWPAFVYREIPEYPRMARAAGLEGKVYVKILVDRTGAVRNVIIVKSSGAKAGFEEAALAAAQKCTFSPAIQNGIPIAIWVTFPFEFKLRR